MPMSQLRSNTYSTSLNLFRATSTASSKKKPVNGCAVATRMIGRYWPRRSDWLVRSGARTRTSSEQVLRSGQQIVSRSSSKCVLKPSSQRKSEFRVRISGSALRGPAFVYAVLPKSICN